MQDAIASVDNLAPHAAAELPPSRDAAASEASERRASKTVELVKEAMECFYEERMCILNEDGSRLLEKGALLNRKQFCAEWCESEDGLLHTDCIEISQYTNLVFEDGSPWKDVGRALKVIERDLPELFVLRGSKLRKGSFGPLGWEWLLWLRRSSLTMYDVTVGQKVAKVLGLDREDSDSEIDAAEVGGGVEAPKLYKIPAITYTNANVGFETDPQLGRRFVVSKLKPHEKVCNRVFDKEVLRMWNELLGPHDTVDTITNPARGDTASSNLRWLQKLGKQQRDLKSKLFAEIIEDENTDKRKLFDNWAKKKKKLAVKLPRHLLLDPEPAASLRHSPGSPAFRRKPFAHLERRLQAGDRRSGRDGTKTNMAVTAAVALSGALMTPDQSAVKIHVHNEHDLEEVRNFKQRLQEIERGADEAERARRDAIVDHWTQCAEERLVAMQLIRCLAPGRVGFEKSWLQAGRLLWCACRGSLDGLDAWKQWAKASLGRVGETGNIPLSLGSYHCGGQVVVFDKNVRHRLVDGSILRLANRNYVVCRCMASNGDLASDGATALAKDKLNNLNPENCFLERLTSPIEATSASQVAVYKDMKLLVKCSAKFWSSFTPRIALCFALATSAGPRPTSTSTIDEEVWRKSQKQPCHEKSPKTDLKRQIPRPEANGVRFRIQSEQLRVATAPAVPNDVLFGDDGQTIRDRTPGTSSRRYQQNALEEMKRYSEVTFPIGSHFFSHDSEIVGVFNDDRDLHNSSPARPGLPPLCGVAPATPFFFTMSQQRPRIFFPPPGAEPEPTSHSLGKFADCVVVQGRTFVFREVKTVRKQATPKEIDGANPDADASSSRIPRDFAWWLVEKLDHVQSLATLRFVCRFGENEFFDNYNRTGLFLENAPPPASPQEFPLGRDYETLCAEGLRLPDWGEVMEFLQDNPHGAQGTGGEADEVGEKDDSQVDLNTHHGVVRGRGRKPRLKSRMRVSYSDFWYENILLWNHTHGGGQNIRYGFAIFSLQRVVCAFQGLNLVPCFVVGSYPPEGVLFQLRPDDPLAAIEKLQRLVSKDRLAKVAENAATQARRRTEAKRAFRRRCNKQRAALVKKAVSFVDSIPGNLLQAFSSAEKHHTGISLPVPHLDGAGGNDAWDVVGKLCKAIDIALTDFCTTSARVCNGDSQRTSPLFVAWLQWGLRSDKWKFFSKELGFTRQEFEELCKDDWATLQIQHHASIDAAAEKSSGHKLARGRKRQWSNTKHLRVEPQLQNVFKLEKLCQSLENYIRKAVFGSSNVDPHGGLPQLSTGVKRSEPPCFSFKYDQCTPVSVTIQVSIPSGFGNWTANSKNKVSTADQSVDFTTADAANIEAAALRVDWGKVFEIESGIVGVAKSSRKLRTRAADKPSRSITNVNQYVPVATVTTVKAEFVAHVFPGLFIVRLRIKHLLPSQVYALRVNRKLLPQVSQTDRSSSGNPTPQTVNNRALSGRAKLDSVEPLSENIGLKKESVRFFYMTIVTRPLPQKVVVRKEFAAGAVSNSRQLDVEWKDDESCIDKQEQRLQVNSHRLRHALNRTDSLTFQLFVQTLPPNLHLWSADSEVNNASQRYKQAESYLQWQQVYEGSLRRFTITNLIPGHTYRLRVRALNSEGRAGDLAVASTSTSCKLAPPHTPVALKVGTTSALIWLPLRHLRDRYIWSIKDFYALRLQSFMSKVLRQRKQQESQRKGRVVRPPVHTLMQEVTIELRPVDVPDTTKTDPPIRSQGANKQVSRPQTIVHRTHRCLHYCDFKMGTVRLPSEVDGTGEGARTTVADVSDMFPQERTFCVRVTGLSPNTMYTVRSRERLLPGNEETMFKHLQKMRTQVAAATHAGWCFMLAFL